ncbi:Cytochrome B561 [hydrothermal vent metagenome]|uniref:Cytochrome B561 n=1 Tax=hydrothermal vent metagenome TaxID=652676 RepID=A0A3B0VTK5_9ZZZZ
MKMKNIKNNFGIVTILIHWIMAVIVIGLFVLGTYMMSLDYYDPFYHTGPWWHKGFGLLVAFLLIPRIVWRIINPKVQPIVNHKTYEIKLALIMQYVLYLLIIVCCISGYMISTAEDAGISFFGAFEVPALISKGKSQADLAGQIHYYSTLALIILASLHMLAALKHHFFDKDKTLIRILKTGDTT